LSLKNIGLLPKMMKIAFWFLLRKATDSTWSA
jgi:hypothetical protein